MTAEQRRALRAKAHHLHPVVAVGTHGLTPAVLREIDIALKAHELIKIRVFSDVRSERDALLFSISSNGAHGLPRTNADKRKAVTLLLADAEWSQWSDSEIARHCQVSQSFVTGLRRSASNLGDKMRARKVKRGDKVHPL